MAATKPLLNFSRLPEFYYVSSKPGKVGFLKLLGCNSGVGKGFSSSITGGEVKSRFIGPIRALEASRSSQIIGKNENSHPSGCGSQQDVLVNDCDGLSGKERLQASTVGNSTNIFWHKCSVERSDREELLQQKGCVVWITGLSGSGKSTVACALSRGLHARRKLTYILDGDNVRHGLSSDLSFGAEDRTENIRRVGEVAKLFADAGVICIVSLISPYRKERDACRALLPEGDFIEVFLDVPLHVCEARDPKGLYKLARAGKIKGFTGIDDPYEPPENSEIVLRLNRGFNDSPYDMAGAVISYLEEKGYLKT
nr:adenylyl-sulfate kinase 3-like [Ipomoea batatas]